MRLFRRASIGRAPVTKAIPAVPTRKGDGSEFAADRPLEAFDLVYGQLQRGRAISPDLAALPHPMVRKFVLALRTVSLEDWGFVTQIAARFHNPDLMVRLHLTAVTELGEARAQDLSSIGSASQVAVLHTFLAWTVRQQELAVHDHDGALRQGWEDLLRWLASGEDWTINAPAAYFAILPFCGPEFAALQSPLSEVLPYSRIATMDLG